MRKIYFLYMAYKNLWIWIIQPQPPPRPLPTRSLGACPSPKLQLSCRGNELLAP